MSLLQKALRGFHASVSAPRLTKIALHPPQKVKVEYADGSVYSLSAEFLRIHSPAADSKLRSVDGEKVVIITNVVMQITFSSLYFYVILPNGAKLGQINFFWSPPSTVDVIVPNASNSASYQVIFGRRYVGIMSAEPVGNYGVRIVFDDLHKTGIYTWDYFFFLGSNKFGLMRKYIKTLRKYGLTRDPQKKETVKS